MKAQPVDKTSVAVSILVAFNGMQSSMIGGNEPWTLESEARAKWLPSAALELSPDGPNLLPNAISADGLVTREVFW